VLALGALLLLPGLGGYPLVDPTEARHAAVAREMELDGRLLSPVLYGEPYHDKPAPYYLLLRAARRLPIGTETGLRLPSVVATLATAALLLGFASRRTGARAAAVGSAIFLASPLVVALGRFADQDALLCALVTAAVVGLLEALDDPGRGLVGAAVAMGTGSLVKGPVAIVLPVLVAGAVAIARGRAPAGGFLRRAALAVAAASAIFATWAVPAWLVDPEYVGAFLLRHNVGRFADGSTGHARPAWFYLPTLAGVLLPWSLLLPAAIAAGRGSEEPRRGAERDLLAWAAAIVGFYSLSRAKSAGYVLPAVGPVALWLGSRLVAIADSARDPGLHPARATAEPARTSLVEGSMRGALVGLAVLGATAPIVVAIALRNEDGPLAAHAALLLALPALVGALAARAAWRDPRPLRSTAAWTGLFTLVLSTVAWVAIAPLASTVASDRHLARFAAERAPGLPLVGFRLHPASLAFYSPGRVRKEVDVEEVKRLAATGPIVVLARERDERALAEAGLRLHRWTAPGRHGLYGTTPIPPVPAPVPDAEGAPPPGTGGAGAGPRPGPAGGASAAVRGRFVGAGHDDRASRC
jgi:4-amino-4-deoxy-L-arabinose transferase-like glycosyltransferase